MGGGAPPRGRTTDGGKSPAVAAKRLYPPDATAGPSGPACCSVTLLVGPARSGKTSAALARYREALGTKLGDPSLWIAPNQRGAQAIREQLLGPELSGCFRPGVFTFERLAEFVLATAEPAVRIDRLTKRELLRQVIAEALRTGQLTYFESIARTTGFVELVDEWIGELKRLEIWPEQFLRACGGAATAKDRQLAGLYEQYQDRLKHHGLYDTEGRLWSARTLLSQGRPPGWQQLDTVVVDGFTDFTRTQLEILQLLAARARTMLFTLPDEPGDDRRDLFAKPRATRRVLGERFTGLQVQWLARRGGAWPAMAFLEAELFGDPRRKPQPSDGQGIELLAAPGPSREIELVGRRIKRLLHQGDPQTGQAVAPSEILVVSRSVSDIAAPLEHCFTRLGLPLALETGTPLGRVPLVRAVAEVFRLHVEDWPLARLVAVLTNNYFAPAWSSWNDPQTLPACLRLLRRLELPEGRAALADRTRNLIERSPQPAESPESRARQAEQRESALLAQPIWKHLSDALEVWPLAAPAATWADCLKHTAGELGWLRAIDQAGTAAEQQLDRESWQRLLAVFEQLAQLDRRLDQGARDLTPAQVLELIEDLSRWEEIRAPAGPAGAIRVVSVASARTLAAPYVFLVGLTESSFPRGDRDDRFYSESELAELARAGLPLVLRGERQSEEMLLFYESVTRATRRLVLSYPALDEKAEPLLASSYVRDLAGLLGQSPHVAPEQLDLSPVPGDDELWTARDFRVRAVAEALESKVALLAGWRGYDPAAQQSPANSGGARPTPTVGALPTPWSAGAPLFDSLEMIAARAGNRQFGRYEGLLTSPAARSWFAHTFGPDYRWTASQLESYDYCPFRFLVDGQLGLQSWSANQGHVDHARRGAVLHEALAAIHRQDPGDPADLAQFEEAFWQVAQQVLERELGGEEQTPLALAVGQIERVRTQRLLRRYLEQISKYPREVADKHLALRPTHFEVSFGLRQAEGDPLSTTRPLALSLGQETIQLSGRIDRIDVARSHEGVWFAVIDYKSGAGASRSDPLAQRGLQLPLYALAVEQLLLAEQPARLVQMGYWYLGGKGFTAWTLEAGAGRAADPAPLLARLSRLLAGIRGAQFPMFSPDPDCTARCPLNHVCRVQATRALDKQWQPPPADQV